MSNKIITFGGTSSTANVSYFPTDLGGQFIGCNANTVIDQIWVSSGGTKTTYGGNGGNPAGSVELPANGLIHLKEIWLGKMKDRPIVISYLKFGVMNDAGTEEIVIFGTPSAYKEAICMIDQLDLWVKFYEIHYGNPDGGYVDQLSFKAVD